ncbi:MAG: Holliday junction resolvase RuvX [Terriglobales bacterium]
METKSTTPGRLLGLDVGTRTIGLAVSDPLGITAQGLPTLRRKNKRSDLAELERVIRDQNVVEIVVGYPLHLSGGQTAGSERVAGFAEELRQKFALPVHLWDERLTTAEAQRVLRDAEMSIRRRGQVVDQMAAVLILQSFMEARRARATSS